MNTKEVQLRNDMWDALYALYRLEHWASQKSRTAEDFDKASAAFVNVRRADGARNLGWNGKMLYKEIQKPSLRAYFTRLIRWHRESLESYLEEFNRKSIESSLNYFTEGEK